ncbi:MAG TPA: hypothetical protein VKM55_15040 [Candidatus Lokiarchaeia archaeon]|nr:hypothetical protein [Candidatus Lokiarchaeia archaeon]
MVTLVATVERIDFKGAECNYADTLDLEVCLKQLEEHHSKLARDKEYTEAFDVMQKIKSTKKEFEALKLVVPDNKSKS